MADEFFRPFTQGLYAKIAPGLWYSAAVDDTSSTLGTTAVELGRNFTYSGSDGGCRRPGSSGRAVATATGKYMTGSPVSAYRWPRVPSSAFADVDEPSANTAIRLGMNFYPTNTRNHLLNLQCNRAYKSPVSSTFGYYVGGHEGDTFSLAASIFF